MGNQESAECDYGLRDAITYENSKTEPDYHYSIAVDSFSKTAHDDANTEYIYRQILDIENVVLYKHINKIMFVLSRKNQITDANFTDYFLFRYRKEPILQIHNTSAQMNKWSQNRNPEIFNCIVCDIDLIRKDLETPYTHIFASIPSIGLM